MIEIESKIQKSPRILLLSGYHASSHEYWAELLREQLSAFDWTLLALPGRHFYWRIRSNAITFAQEHQDTLKQHYDLIVATSMVDLNNLRGLVPALSGVPSILYFHENQFAYPVRQGGVKSGRNMSGQKNNSNLINAQLTSIYSALCADTLVFNSQYNRDSFLQGVGGLIDKMPDGIDKNTVVQLESKSHVLPVPVTSVKDQWNKNTQPNVVADTVEIVWNHRWEYDKQPQVFLTAVDQLLSMGVNCQVHLVGQTFRERPDCFDEFQKKHKDSIASFGFQTPERYAEVLNRADIVVSSALHDFQGLGMLEAIDSGCIPIAPARMAYPEYLPPALLYPVQADVNEEHEAQALSAKLRAVINSSDSSQPDVSRYLSAQVLPRYEHLFERCIG